MSSSRVPVFLVLLDVLGSILAILGILGALDFDLGMPALASIWPVLLVLGFSLMIPMIVWAVKLARSKG